MGDRLRKARTETGMSVDEFAVQCLVSAKTVNNYEGDKVKQRPLVLEKWAAVTGVSLRWIEHGDAPEQPTPPGVHVDNPDPADDGGDALARLTQAKLSRSRHSGGSTQRYPQAA